MPFFAPLVVGVLEQGCARCGLRKRQQTKQRRENGNGRDQFEDVLVVKDTKRPWFAKTGSGHIHVHKQKTHRKQRDRRLLLLLKVVVAPRVRQPTPGEELLLKLVRARFEATHRAGSPRLPAQTVLYDCVQIFHICVCLSRACLGKWSSFLLCKINGRAMTKTEGVISFFAMPFLYKNDLFTKTGSGQT
jgi:hypothetical protein